MAWNPRAWSAFQYPLIFAALFLSNLPGCGGLLADSRSSLPSTIVDDPATPDNDNSSLANDNGSNDVIDPAGLDPSEFQLEATQDPENAGKWNFAVKAPARQPINDTALQFEWDFGDGVVAFGSSQVHLFSEPGEHLVVVRAVDRSGEALFTLTLVVTVPPPNEPPSADAGADQVAFEGDVVALSGARSRDPEGVSLSYSWAQVGSGPSVTLSNPRAALTTFTAPDVTRDTVLQFELQVDDGTNTSQDVVIVEVLDSIDNAAAPPTAIAGADLQASAGETVMLDGSSSLPSAGGTLTFEWVQTQGPSVTLSDAQSARPSFVAPPVTEPQVLTFVLTVFEDDLSGFDDVAVTVSPAVTLPGGGGGGGSESDACPDDPLKTDPGLCGCGVPDTDSDGDGTPDCNDSCPADPAKIAAGVCGCGVSEVDSDSDGVPDCNDACPGFDDAADADDDGTPDGCEPPSLCVSTTSLNFGLVTSQLSFQVRNCGGGSLSYTVSDNRAWLSASPTSGTSTGESDTITAAVDRTGLADNSYGGTITVTPSTGSAIAIIVSMSVAQGPGPAPTISLVPTRTSGVSPFGVFFDASGTTSPSTSRPFHELNYEWDFGDPNATFKNVKRCTGTAMPCSTNSDCAPGQSCNPLSTAVDSGPMVAHVFELPRTCSGSGASCQTDGNCPSGQTCNEVASKNYTVTLTVRDANGVTATAQQIISVTRFSGTTYYAASGVNENGQSTGSAGSDTNNGLTPATAFKSWEKAITMLFLSNGPRRVLLRRGDAFNATQAFAGSTSISNKTGPYILGAYGTGADPVIQTLHESTTLEFKSTTSDVRLMDLEFRGPPAGTQAGTALGVGKDFVILRITVRQYRTAIGAGWGFTSGSIIADSTLADQDDYGIYYSSGTGNAPPKHIGFIGCTFDRVVSEHLVRTYITHSVISHNTFRNGNSRGHYLKLCGAGETDQLKSARMVVAGNAWVPPGESAWICSVGPENVASRQLVEDVIFERNVFDFRTSAGGQDAIQSRGANDVTVRNNLFLDTRSWVALGSPVPGFSTFNNWHIYNNTSWRNLNVDTTLVRVSDTGNAPQGMVIRNNIGAVLQATTPVVKALDLAYVPTDAVQASNNLWYFPTQSNGRIFTLNGSSYAFSEWQALGKGTGSLLANPLFADGPLNLTLQAASPAVNSGTHSGTAMEDILHVHRPVGSAPDMGAFERN
ncbi:MAG: PKD domain-containing protein [Phycisphaerae bacterium]|nr:PKD domain-containing protein [Phycisphaerae bacterium]